MADNVGGTTIGRPYASGSYSVSQNGTIVYTQSRPEYPAELAVIQTKKNAKLITNLNADVLAYRELGKVEEVCAGHRNLRGEEGGFDVTFVGDHLDADVLHGSVLFLGEGKGCDQCECDC